MTRTDDLITEKLHWNSVIAIPGVKYMCLDCSNFYLEKSMGRYEYMGIQQDLSPDKIMSDYNLYNKVKNGFMYKEIIKEMYGLPLSGIIAKKFIKKHLAKFGYYEVKHTQGIFCHTFQPI